MNGLTTYAIAPASRARSTSSRWLNAVSRTTGAIRARTIRSAAEMPSRTGILTSITTRSGRSSSASRTACSPSPASPTTSKPAVAQHLDDVEPDQRLVLGDDDAAGGAGGRRLVGHAGQPSERAGARP